MIKNNGDTTGGQWCARNTYCPKCKATGNSAHEAGCDGEKVIISSTARFPKKTASKKVWDEFYDKFVTQTELKEKLTEVAKKDRALIAKLLKKNS
jgi:hypothetical protein